MRREIFVGIFEDDSFSRQWMAMLLVRDWRTCVVGEFGNRADLYTFFDKPGQPMDVLIIDTDLLGEIFTIQEVSGFLESKGLHTKILLTGVQPDSKMVRQFNDERIRGYVLKSEIEYSLNWAITFVNDGYRIVTPAIKALADNSNFSLPSQILVIKDLKPFLNFTDHENQAARLAIIFSLSRRDLADELKISQQWSYGLVSELYKKIGLNEIITGDINFSTQVGENTLIYQKFQEFISTMRASRKVSDMETLAFHILTMPEIL